MRNIFVMIVLLSVTACSSTKAPKTEKVEVPDNLIGPKVANYKEVEYLHRQEVIQASKDCINARMKPIVQYVPQKTQFGTLMLPAVVTCENYTHIR
ncbi:MAG: hypothetical protein EBU90_26760 [Proteobacteria bacterium]|nr:hypothetical protein [Pseudomonadota bacterium]